MVEMLGDIEGPFENELTIVAGERTRVCKRMVKSIYSSTGMRFILSALS